MEHQIIYGFLNINIIIMALSLLTIPLTYFRTMRIFFTDSKTPKKLELCICVLVILAFMFLFGFLFPPFPIFNALRNFIVFFLITFNYKSSNLKRLASVFPIMIFVEVGVLPLMFHLNPNNTLEVIHPPYVTYILHLSTILLIQLLVFSLKPFSFIRKDHEHPRIVWLSFISTSAILYALLFTIGIIDLYHHFRAIMVVAIFITFVLTMYLLEKFSTTYQKQLESALHTQEKEHYQAQYEMMQENIELTQALNHDLNLHLNSLREQLSISPEKAQNYLDQLLKEKRARIFYSNTGNLAFDSIINYKLGRTPPITLPFWRLMLRFQLI